jgi:hypothetical protein
MEHRRQLENGVPNNTNIADLATNVAHHADAIKIDGSNNMSWVVAGLMTADAVGTDYTGTVTISGSHNLVVLGDVANGDTGLKVESACTITGGAGNTLEIQGGTGTENYLASGTISTDTFYISSGATINVGPGPHGTEVVFTFGCPTQVGHDPTGYSTGNTLRLRNQTATATLSGVLTVEPKQLTQHNTVEVLTIGTGSYTNNVLTNSGASYYIDNYDTFLRDPDPGRTFAMGMGVPIKNESGALIDFQSDFVFREHVGSRGPPTNNDWVYQVGGETRLENACTVGDRLDGHMYEQDSGTLSTYGSAPCTIEGSVLIDGGYMTFSEDNLSNYGALSIDGDLNWSFGTWNCYVEGYAVGGAHGLYDGLVVTGTADLSSNAYISLTVQGSGQTGDTWDVLTYGFERGTKPDISSHTLTLGVGKATISF